jgi:hypothetical protein
MLAAHHPVIGVAAMPSVACELPLDYPRYSKADLIEHRRNILRRARSLPPGAERNHHRQVALLFRALFKNKAWLDAHTVDGQQ